MRERIGEHSAETADHQKVLNLEHDNLMAKRVKYRVDYYTLREIARNAEVPYSFVKDHMFLTHAFPSTVRCGEHTVNKYDLLLWLRTFAGREFVEIGKALYPDFDMGWVDGYEDDDISGRGACIGDRAYERDESDGQAGVPVIPVRVKENTIRAGGEVRGVVGQPGRAEVAKRKARVAHITRPCSLSEQIRRRREAESVSPVAYLHVKGFIDRLKKASSNMTQQEFMTLRGQAVHGDIEGAERGLQTILSRGGHLGRGR